MNLIERLEAQDAKKAQGNWIPASNGTEVPFTTRTNYRLLYCYQPSTGRHCYLNLDTDMFLTNDEAFVILAL